ncbi:MAG TPA: glycosyltransferase family 87 protein [Gemmataceae bacterium]|nr:glycosyltransferase family 87 protein [Gemmataceae bacterium]
MKIANLTSPVPLSWQRWLPLGLMLFFVALSVPYGIKASRHASAFQRWQPQISALSDGVDIAERFNYPNPPIMALLLYPLARLPDGLQSLGIPEKISSTAAALCWFYIKAALTLLAFRWVFQLVEERSRPFPLWAKCLTVLLAMRPIMSDLQHGNVNLFILFLVVAALAAYHRGRDVLAGIVFGLAIACKVTPALFVPYFLWKRSWKALAGCAAGLILFLWPGLVPAALMGWQNNERHLVSWYYDMVHPFVIEGKVTSEHHNQSLPGLMARLATHSPSFSTYVNNVYTPVHYDNLLDLSPQQARWLVKGCMGLFALIVVWVCRTPTEVNPKSEIRNPKETQKKNPQIQNQPMSFFAFLRFRFPISFGFRISDFGFPVRRGGWRLSAEFSIILLGMLLFSERTWKHHCVTLVLPFAVICYYLATAAPGKGMRAYLIISLAATMLLMAATSNTGQDGASHHDRLYQLFAKQAQVYGTFVLAYFVLLAAMIVLLRRPMSSASVPASNLLPAA